MTEEQTLAMLERDPFLIKNILNPTEGMKLTAN